VPASGALLVPEACGLCKNMSKATKSLVSSRATHCAAAANGRRALSAATCESPQW